MAGFAFRSRRPRRRWIFGSTTALLASAVLFFVASASGVLSGSPSKFEANDGNMVVNTTGNNDWKSVAFFHVTDLASTQSDDSFVSGQKQDTVCPDTYLHGNPPKDDFTDIASYSEVNNDSSSPQNGHTFLYGATIRYAANGNASENVELKQGKNGSCGNGLLARTKGDKLLAIDYLNGGTNVQFHVLTWIVDGSDPNNATCFVSNDVAPCWGVKVDTLSASAAEGLASQASITAANNPISNAALVAGQFAEFGVDLTASGIIPAGECKSFPQTIWESRSSGSSFVSTTKDVSIENKTISNCGTITVIKHTNPRGLNQDFTYTSNLKPNANAGGVAGVDANGGFSLNDSGNTTGDSAANTVSESNLSPGTYTVTEGADPNGFAFDSVSCTGGTTSTSGKVATITLAVNDSVTCTYVNNQQLGAIKITKTSTKGNAALAGAVFTITGPDSSSQDVTSGSDGTVCVDGLGFGSYSVKEKSAPTGYKINDTTTHTVDVNANAKCSDATYVGAALSFSDTPLTTLVVTATGEASPAGTTNSQITCTGPSPGTGDIGNSPTANTDPATMTAPHLEPGTYSCTVVIDP